MLRQLFAACFVCCLLSGPALANAVSSLPEPPTLPLWLQDGVPNSEAVIAVEALQAAAGHGLNPGDYKADELAKWVHDASLPFSALSPEHARQLDAALTQAMTHYLNDLHRGRLDPKVLRHEFKAPPVAPYDAASRLQQGVRMGRLEQVIAEAAPAIPLYGALRQALADYRALGEPHAWADPLPPLPGRSLKPGDAYGGARQLARRLQVLGDLPDGETLYEVYDDTLAEAVRRFQERHGLDDDGVLGPQTLAQINVSPAERARQIELTLERLRWTPLLHARRMIVVNLPEFVLRAYEVEGNHIDIRQEMRVIVGRALDTRTPVFQEDMRFIEFSPYWNVPISIARGELLPRLQRDPDYLHRQGFEFVTSSGSVVTTVSQEAIDAVRRGEWRLRQRPGPLNALGDIKFIFPNDMNIYLHHTPSTGLFERARRDFSHGCIRVQDPVSLAQFVLEDSPGWSRERIEAAMTSGISRTIRLDAPLPVLIAYSTVVHKDGKVFFFPDIYQQDKRLADALRDRRRPVIALP